MDLDRIKSIVNSDTTNETKEFLILATLAEDRRLIPYLIALLDIERKESKALIQDFNAKLSLADMYIDAAPLSKRKSGLTYTYVSRQIDLFYAKWRKCVTHRFKKQNYPSPNITNEDIEKELM